MGLYKQLKTVPDFETNGVWIDYGEFKIKIARAGGANKNFAKCAEKLSRPYRRAIQTGMISVDKAEEILLQVYAKSVILDWEDVTDENDKKLDFSEENVIKVMTDLPDLFNDIKNQASSPEIFRENIPEQDAKNS